MIENIESFIQNIPKAELHLHIEGTLEPKLIFQLAERNKVKLQHESVDELQGAYDFHNLQSFLDIYYEGASVLLQEQDFYDMTMAYIQKISSQNVLHAEIFFDPQTHTERGIRFETIILGINKAIEDGKKKYNISLSLIMCFLRHLSTESAMKTLEQSIPFKNIIVGVGLDSSEKGNPPSKFKDVFSRAISLGYFTVAHAGEEGPAEYIWEAINLLKVKRIDHGVRCLEDKLLVNELVKKQMPLTVCPLSNIKLAVFKNMEEHNIKKLIDSNLLVTINSDDPSYFGGYINENYLAIQKAFDLSRDDIYLLAKNSFKASFLKEEDKQKLIERLDNYVFSTKPANDTKQGN